MVSKPHPVMSLGFSDRPSIKKKNREKSRKTTYIDLWPLQRSILVDTLVLAHTNVHTPIKERDGEEGEEEEKGEKGRGRVKRIRYKFKET